MMTANPAIPTATQHYRSSPGGDEPLGNMKHRQRANAG
jgi:hypothetical protein